MNPLAIKKFLDSGAGKSMKDFLLEKLSELKNIDNVQRFKTEKSQIVEIDSQQKAYNKLKEILGDIMTIDEINEKKPEKDEYGVGL